MYYNRNIESSGKLLVRSLCSVLCRLSGDVHTHRAGCAFHLVHRAFEVEAVQIGHLNLRDLFYLFEGDLADAVLIWLSRTFCQIHGPFDEHWHRRSLGNEGEGTVRVDVYDTG